MQEMITDEDEEEEQQEQGGISSNPSVIRL